MSSVTFAELSSKYQTQLNDDSASASSVCEAVNEKNSSDWNLAKIDKFLSNIGYTPESFDVEVKLYSFGTNDNEISHLAIEKGQFDPHL